MTHTHDILIVGGGLNGLSMALALGTAGVSVGLIEANPMQKMASTQFDARTTALSFGSKRFFQAHDLWEKLVPHAGAINDIRIVDQDSPKFLHYDHKDVGDEPMGHIVENRHLREVLFDAVDALDAVTFYAPAKYETLDLGQHAAHVVLEDGRELSTKLLIASDGKFSKLREKVGIKHHFSDYGQTAMICGIAHAEDHEGIAIERFLPSGPFAVLPLAGGKQSSIVWTDKTERVQDYLALDDDKFLAEIKQRAGDHLGEISLFGPRGAYPVPLVFCREYTKRRFALIGDAAHGIHPIAGQGFNLGLRDVAALAELIVDQMRVGLDAGSDTVLKAYESRRKLDNASMIAATDGLNRLFSNDNAPIEWARQTGLSIVEQTPSLKKYFMQSAMGLRGDLPRLLRGDAI